MIAQADQFGQIAPVIAWLVGVAVAFGPGARGITWIVDRIRDALPVRISDNPSNALLWPALAFGVSLVACLAFELNVIGSLFTQLPRFAGSTALDGTWGQLVTAVALAGFASFWHDHDVSNNPATPHP